VLRVCARNVGAGVVSAVEKDKFDLWAMVRLEAVARQLSLDTLPQAMANNQRGGIAEDPWAKSRGFVLIWWP